VKKCVDGLNADVGAKDEELDRDELLRALLALLENIACR
jgi:hypothetical protein